MSSALIRLVTCGSVDDGKSTLIGRLLVETDSVPHDTVDAAKKVRRTGSVIPAGEIDFSLLTDGLEAEREQGITIDVAYRSMNLRNGSRLVIADAPGHEQYTRNMVVAASRANIALVLVDATRGIRTQTLRHTSICSLSGVERIIIVINKLDTVGFKKEIYKGLVEELQQKISHLTIKELISIPVSALSGDNVSTKSENLSWFEGPTLLEAIENWVPSAESATEPHFRVQSVARTENFRGVSGTLEKGVLNVGDELKVLPSKLPVKISEIIKYQEQRSLLNSGETAILRFENEVDVARGDVLISNIGDFEGSDRFVANLVWLDEEPLVLNRSYLLLAGSAATPAIVVGIKGKQRIVEGGVELAKSLEMNEIGEVEIATDKALVLRNYLLSRNTGNFILIDRKSMQSSGAGMFIHTLRRSSNITKHDYEITSKERSLQKNQSAKVIWLTGLSGSGKSTIANLVEKELFAQGKHCYVLDGDNIRLGINRDLGFTPEDRAENVRRVAEIARLFVDAGLIVIVALVSPFEVDRQAARSLFNREQFAEVWIDTSPEVCEQRDPKGLYKKAKEGKLPNLTGVGQEYEPPSNPELIVDGGQDLQRNVIEILRLIP
jgi:bifunctional enzyme CysN/CysC